MTKGIYLYYDTEKKYINYVGKDSHIDEMRRDKAHRTPSLYKAQPINQVLQNNPGRYVCVKFVEGEYNDEELNSMEEQAIELFKTYHYEYSTKEKPVFNFTKGGDGVSGYKHSEEHNRKISESLKGKKFSDERKRKLSEANKGKTLPMETRKKISEVHKGRIFSEEHRRKLSESLKGKTFSDEHKRKLSESRNTTGYLNLCKVKDSTNKQGFRWKYSYSDDGKQKYIKSVDLRKLKEKVLAKGLQWFVIDEEKAKATCDEYGYIYEDLI